MNIAVVGAGAVGSVIAGRLKTKGVDVSLVGRGGHLRAIAQNGLLVRYPDGVECVNLATFRHLDREYDLVIFASKVNDLEDLYQENHCYLENCLVMTVQSGVQGANVLSCHFEPEKMIDSHIGFYVTLLKPGEVSLDKSGPWILGRPYTARDTVLSDVADCLSPAFEIDLTDDITAMKWLALMTDFFYCLPAVTGKSVEDVLADSALRVVMIRLFREALGIIQTAGIPMASLPYFSADKLTALTEGPPEAAARLISSQMLHDARRHSHGHLWQSIIRKRASEIDFINGEITQVARSLRVPAPLNETLVQMVHHVEQTGGFFDEHDVVQQLTKE